MHIWKQNDSGTWQSEKIQNYSACCISALEDERFVSGSYDGVLHIWKQNDSGTWQSEKIQNYSACCISALKDNRIVSRSYDGVLHLWQQNDSGTWQSEKIQHFTDLISNTTTFNYEDFLSNDDDNLEERHPDQPYGYSYSSIQITPLGKNKFISQGIDNRLGIWKQYGNLWSFRKLTGDFFSINSITKLDDGRIISISGNTLREWNINIQELVMRSIWKVVDSSPPTNHAKKTHSKPSALTELVWLKTDKTQLLK